MGKRQIAVNVYVGVVVTMPHDRCRRRRVDILYSTLYESDAMEWVELGDIYRGLPWCERRYYVPIPVEAVVDPP